MPRKPKRRSWGAWSIAWIPEPRARWRVRPPASVDPKRPARYFRERVQAERWIAAEQQRLAAAPATSHELGPDVTLELWLGYWYGTTADAADWTASTRAVYREHLWYWSRLYDVRLADLTTTRLNEVAGLLRTVGAVKRPEVEGRPPPKAPRPLSNRTVRAACTTLQRALEAARDDGLIQRNPAVRMARPRVVAQKPTIWTLKERRAVYAALEHDDLYAAFLVEIEDGLRAGEVLGLKWSDIDFERGVLLVRRTVHKTIQEWPKSRKPREVPMGRYSLRALLRHRDRGVMTGSGVDGWVFCRPDGGPVRYGQLRHRLLRACERAGIQYRSSHVARHLHSTLLLAAGIPPADVAERLGHSGLGTLSTYTHPQADKAQQIVNAASEIVAQILAPSDEVRHQNGHHSPDSDDTTRRETA